MEGDLFAQDCGEILGFFLEDGGKQESFGLLGEEGGGVGRAVEEHEAEDVPPDVADVLGLVVEVVPVQVFEGDGLCVDGEDIFLLFFFQILLF